MRRSQYLLSFVLAFSLIAINSSVLVAEDITATPQPTVTTQSFEPTKTPIVASTESKTTSDSLQDHFYLEIAGGIDLPTQNWQSTYTLGPGGKISLGYEFDKSLAILLDMENFYFSGTNYSGSISDTELLILPTIRYSFSEHGIRPYLLAGVGMEFEFLTATPGSLTVGNFDLAVGAGLDVQLAQQTYAFVEGKYNFIFSPEATGQDIPVLAGIRFGI